MAPLLSITIALVASQLVMPDTTRLLVFAIQQPPHLECLESGMRLHFAPDISADGLTPLPFNGHVYVKGFFIQPQTRSRCHLDFTRAPISAPFYFHLPYRSGDCQLRRERTNENSIPGIVYSTVVVVQHHRLFLTDRDKAYSVSCFYQDNRHRVEQRIEVGDLTTQPLQGPGVDMTPNCTYRVMRSGVGAEEARFANVGEPLLHRWECSTTPDNLGILVHSCFVRDGVGAEYALIDERGCVTDNDLLPHPLAYDDSLHSAMATINAFKFADQMIVYFSCQITLCDRNDNGCEGITPPSCAPGSAPPIYPPTSMTASILSTTATAPTTTTTSFTTTMTTTPQPTEETTILPLLFHNPAMGSGSENALAAHRRLPQQHRYATSSRHPRGTEASYINKGHREAVWIPLNKSSAPATPMLINLFGGSPAELGVGSRGLAEGNVMEGEAEISLFPGRRRRSGGGNADFARTNLPGLVNFQREQHRIGNVTTVDVSAERLMVFGKDEQGDMEQAERILHAGQQMDDSARQKEQPSQQQDERSREVKTASDKATWESGREKAKGRDCEWGASYAHPVWMGATIALLLLSTATILLQRSYYRRLLKGLIKPLGQPQIGAKGGAIPLVPAHFPSSFANGSYVLPAMGGVEMASFYGNGNPGAIAPPPGNVVLNMQAYRRSSSTTTGAQMANGRRVPRRDELGI